MPASADLNVARHLELMAEARPRAAALKVPRGRSRRGEIDYLALSFAELAAEVRAWNRRLTARGVRPGDRALLLVRPGLPLIASAFALFQIGAVPIVIDPGMGWGSFLSCVARSRPRALVGVPLALGLSRLFPRAFRTVALRVRVQAALTARLATREIEIPQPQDKPTADCQGTSPGPCRGEAQRSLAAILFTSGSTGRPKGVCYEAGMFAAQIDLLRKTYGIEPGEVDLPMLPIFALFNPALGLTTVVPEIDPRRPAAADPAKIVQAIRQEAVTNSFGSPTLWGKVAAYCRAHSVSLPSLRRVLCAGAPVPAALWSEASAFLPHGRLHSPYGATEALPISSIGGDEAGRLLLEGVRSFSVPSGTEGTENDLTPSRPAGSPLGRPLPGMRVKIIALADGPIAKLSEARELPPGEIGEIVVSGPVVTKEYDGWPEANALAKIADDREGGAERIWHRMGDCGYFDVEGRLWFCGRKAERVETAAGPLYPEPCERVFRDHPRARCCALIGLGRPGRQRPALVVETAVTGAQAESLARELRDLARRHPHTAAIEAFYFRPEFPVDVRHNAKIHRLELARWAARPGTRCWSVA